MLNRIAAFLLLMLSFCSFANAQKTPKKQIAVCYNRTIETYMILRALSDSDYVFGYLMRNNKKLALNVRPLLYDAQQYFKAFKKHPAVAETQKLQNKIEDFGGIACQGLLYADELPAMKLRVEPTDDYWKEHKAELIEYLKVLHTFYEEAKVEAFFSKHAAYYAGAIAEAKGYINDRVIETMEAYFGKQNDAYTMVIIPLNPFSMGFGANIGKDLYEIISPANDTKWFSTGIYTTYGYGGDGAKEYFRDMVTHEFCHSFITTTIDQKLWRMQIDRYDSLYTSLLDSFMQNQGYGDWWNFANELLVRMGEIRVTAAMGLKMDALEMLKENLEKNRFVLLPDYLDRMEEEYEKHRDRYPTIEHFLPDLIKNFANYSTQEIDTRLKSTMR